MVSIVIPVLKFLLCMFMHLCKYILQSYCLSFNSGLCLYLFSSDGYLRCFQFPLNEECDSGYYKGTCTPMFIAALFTIAKLWKQPRCPTTDEWINMGVQVPLE
jgi:hypothetical protein